MSTIFLDRDGVINENRADYVTDWSSFCFLPGAREAISRLTSAGHCLIICTNQAGIAKGLISVEILKDIHQRMLASIQEAGGHIERIYYCPHSKDEQCKCRKPQPGLLLCARNELRLDLCDAVFIGDSITDMQAGLAAGVRPILVLSGRGLEQFLWDQYETEGSFRITRNLPDAVEFVLQKLHLYPDTLTAFEHSCYSILKQFKYFSGALSPRDQLAFAAKMLSLEGK